MEPRTFRAPNTQSALEMVQQELGAEAMILSVREIPSGPAWQTWKKPDIEVLAIPAQNYNSNQFSDSSNISQPNQIDSDIPLSPKSPRDYRRMKSYAQDITQTELIKALADLAGPQSAIALRHKNSPESNNQSLQLLAPEDKNEKQELKIPKALVEVRNHLLDQGVDKQLVNKVITTCGNTQSSYALENPARISNHIKYQLEAYIRTLKVDPAIRATTDNKCIVCVVGLSGSGKTSSLAKLAAYYLKTLGKKVAWICADTIRTGAISLAQTYTQSLNIPLYLAYTPQDLEQAIQNEKQAEIIMLDTSAHNPYQESEIVDLGTFLTIVPQKVVYLTAPATAKEKDLRQAWVAYSPFDISGFIVTKLDETTYYGDILNLAWHTQAPLAYFTFGTQILDNLIKADAKKCAGLVLGERIIK